MNPEIKEWLSYAVEKLDEVALISHLFTSGIDGLNDINKKSLKMTKERNGSLGKNQLSP